MSRTLICHEKAVLERIAGKIGVKTVDGWCNIKRADLNHYGAGFVVKRHGMPGAILKHYSSDTLHPWRFSSVPHSFWDDMDNHKLFFTELAKSRGWKLMSDWYSVTMQDIADFDGAAFVIYKYAASPVTAVMKVFKEYKWQPWKFHSAAPRNHWGSGSNIIKFIECLAEKNNFKCLQDLYKLTSVDITEFGGSGLLFRYSNSAVGLIRSAYPDYGWDVTRFAKTPQGYWHKESHALEFYERAIKELHIDDPQKWYTTSVNDLRELGCTGALIWWPFILEKLHPEVEWDWDLLAKKDKRAKQTSLISSAKNLF